MKKLIYLFTILLTGHVAFSQQQTQAQQSFASAGNTLKDFLTQRAAESDLKQTRAVSTYNKELRNFLYTAVENYSNWYLDSTFSLSTAMSAISDETGEPDYMKLYGNRNIADIRKAYVDQDGKKLVEELFDDIYFATTSSFPRELFIYKDLSDDKNIAKAIKDADKGKLPGILTMIYFYSRSLNFGGTVINTPQDIQNGERYFQAFLADKTIQNGNITKTKPITQCAYLLRSNMYLQQKEVSKHDLMISEKSLCTADSLCNLQGYVSGNASGQSYFADFYHNTEQLYDMVYFIIKDNQLKTYYALINNTETIPAEKKIWNDKIINIYTEVSNNPDMKAIFKSPIFKRPYTNDMEWNQHHGK